MNEERQSQFEVRDGDDSSLILTYRRLLVVVVHLFLWSASFVGAFALRFDFDIPDKYSPMLWPWMAVVLGLRTLASFSVGGFQGIWRYTGTRDLMVLFKATTMATLLFVFYVVVTGTRSFPRSVFVIDWLGTVILVGGFRFTVRTLRELSMQAAAAGKQKRLLIVGAGNAGEMLLREIQKVHSRRYDVVGFVDDDRSKLKGQIHGVSVLGSISQAPEIVALENVDEIIIAIPTATGKQMRQIVSRCRVESVPVRTIPSIDSLIDGSVTLTQVRDVAIEDLLGREPVVLDTAAVSDFIRDQRVMITGAGGSIGSELCRQVVRFAPSSLVLVERAENALFYIHRELRERVGGLIVQPRLADICDRTRMGAVFKEDAPTVVFHAAAHKHVPMMEWNPGEAVKNNAFGTRTIADLAVAHDVRQFVMISTDKAVNPTSFMGTTKRVAEIYTQALSTRCATRFVTVRFGNVLGSAGSVIPIFKEQIAAGGPVTVTHPDMQRYFMTISEACQLVLQAATMGQGGEIFILDMGEAVRIADLANDLITLSGLKVGEDIEISYTGIRPGEKLFEELSISDENAEKTVHPKIFVGRIRHSELNQVQRGLDAVARAAESGDASAIRAALAGMVPEFSPRVPDGIAESTGEAGIAEVIAIRN